MVLEISVVEIFHKVIRKHLPQSAVYTRHSARMDKFHRGLAVGVCSDLCIGMDNSVERVEKVVYADAVRQTACFDKILLPLGKFACGGVFCRMIRSLPTSVPA